MHGSGRGARLLKAFSGGIVLAVGFAHVLKDAQESFEVIMDYPLAEVLAMGGILLVLAASQLVDSMLAGLFHDPSPPPTRYSTTQMGARGKNTAVYARDGSLRFHRDRTHAFAAGSGPAVRPRQAAP
jgi:hypothetical protein